MVLSRKDMYQIFKYTTDIETDIGADDKVSEILNRPSKFPKTTLSEKYIDYNSRLTKNPNSTRNKENFEYINYLINIKNIVIVPENIDEIVTEIITRNKQEKEGKETLAGIYGYFDTKRGKYVYIGKDSNIHINLRDKQHYADDSQVINRILRNDKEGRYEYHVIKTMENPSDLELDTAERYYIKLFGTYHYENPEGMNFTKGGEKSYGIETEAKIDRTKVINKINSTYKGERDGKKQKHGVYTFGNDGDTFILTTNGGGDRGTQYAIKNKNKEHKKVMQSMNLNRLLERFNNLNFKNSELINSLS